MEMEKYQIGYLFVFMTPEQAYRWNMGESTNEDFHQIIVCIPGTDRGLPIHDEVPLIDALDKYPDFVDSAVNDGYEAEKV